MIAKNSFFIFLIVSFFTACSSVSTHSVKLDNIIKSNKQNSIIISSKIDDKVTKDVILKLMAFDERGGRISLYIQNGRGWINDAFAIVDIINSIQTPVDVYVVGECDYAGMLIVLSATGKRYAYEDSVLLSSIMIPYDNTTYSQVKIDRERFDKIWRVKSKVPNSWYPISGKGIKEMSSKEAKRYGIIDKIIKE